MSEIKNAISTLIGIEDMVYFNDCKVISTDENTRTCIVNNGVNDIEVRLMTVIDDGILIMPAVDSIVSILQSDKYDPIIVQFSEVEKIILIGGDNKGLVKVIELTTKLNNLENKVNSIISTFNTHIHTSAPAGSPTTTTPTIISGILTPTQQTDIENPLIKH